MIIFFRLSSKQPLPVKCCTLNNYLESLSFLFLILDTILHPHCFQSIVFTHHKVRHSSQMGRKFLFKIFGSHVHPCRTSKYYYALDFHRCSLGLILNSMIFVVSLVTAFYPDNLVFLSHGKPTFHMIYLT